MRIYTEIDYEWDGEKLVEVSSESFDYDGELAEMKGGGGPRETINKQEPWDEAKPYYEYLYGQAQDMQQTPMEYYPGQTVADQTANQIASQDMLANYATNQAAPTMNLGFNQVNSVLRGDYLSPTSNPYLRENVNYAIGDVINKFNTEALPNIRGGAVDAGQYGGSRQGIAEGMAYDSAMNNAMRTASGMYGDNFATERGHMQNTLGGLGSFLQAGAQPGQMLGDVGMQEQAYSQDLINDLVARHNFGQEQGWAGLQNLAAVLNGGNFFSMSSTQPGLQSNPLSTVAGLGMAAGGLLGGGS